MQVNQQKCNYSTCMESVKPGVVVMPYNTSGEIEKVRLYCCELHAALDLLAGVRDDLAVTPILESSTHDVVNMVSDWLFNGTPQVGEEAPIATA